MNKFTKNSDDRALGAAVVAALWATVGAGMSTVMWEFDINQTGATFIVLWLLIFLVLSLGWRDRPEPPGSKKAPTVARAPSAPAAPTAPSAPETPAAPQATAAPSSGTAPAAEAAPTATAFGAATAEVGLKPQSLDAPRGGTADDLKEIKGVGPALEKLCHSLGFYHFDQIAAWTDQEVAWVDEHLEGFKGRVTRDDWVAQAKALVAEKSAAQ